MARPRGDRTVIAAEVAEQLMNLCLARTIGSERAAIAEWQENLPRLLDVVKLPSASIETILRDNLAHYYQLAENVDSETEDADWMDEYAVAATIGALEAYFSPNPKKASQAVNAYLEENEAYERYRPLRAMTDDDLDQRAHRMVLRLDGLEKSLQILENHGVTDYSIKQVRDVLSRQTKLSVGNIGRGERGGKRGKEGQPE
jgi:hypothetical protein